MIIHVLRNIFGNLICNLFYNVSYSEIKLDFRAVTVSIGSVKCLAFYMYLGKYTLIHY